MSWKFSRRSLSHLAGVQRRLVRVVTRALQVSKVDFGVIDGLRTRAEQADLVRSGASKTMNSKHLHGWAVDLMAYVGSRGSWEIDLYCRIADAMVKAAREQGVGIRWGGAWDVPDIRVYEGSMKDAMTAYIRNRLDAGRTPFVDAGHFELSSAEIERISSEEDEEEEGERS